MLPSLNLFKSINCPYHAKPGLICERPYCLFKHPVAASQSTNGAAKRRKVPEPAGGEESNGSGGDSQDASSTSTATAAAVAPAAVPAAAASTSKSEELIKSLPSTIENLTQALQSIQQLIKSTSQLEKQLAPAAVAATENAQASTMAITLANQLTSLTSEILSSVSGTTTATSSTSSMLSTASSDGGSGVDEAARSAVKVPSSPSAAAKAPVYNPTPIYELNKMKMSRPESSTVAEAGEAKRRKLSEEIKSPPPPAQSKSPAAATAAPKTSSDLVSFSKMTLSQQVLKRYEMLNMEPPTAASISKAKLVKKQQQAVDAGTPKTGAGQKGVPHLILDQGASSMKIPLAMRQRYLKMIFDNGREVYGAEKACQRAAEEEKAIYDRAKSKPIYMNLVANLVKTLRAKTATPGVASGSTSPAKASSYSHEAILSGPKASRVSYSINRTKHLEAKDLSETDLYRMFLKYVLTEEQLEANGFPNWLPGSGATNRLVYIPNFHQTKITSSYLSSGTKKPPVSKESTTGATETTTSKTPAATTLIRECKRCKSTFKLLLRDMSYYAENSACVYHWGKMRNQRFNRAVEQKYSCCGGGTGSEGCEIGKHVYDGDYDGHGTGTNIVGYVQTQDKRDAREPLRHQTARNIFSVDCEMCYTTAGLELARVSVVDVRGAEAYESLVRPATEVVDYNSRWSGLTAETLRGCTKSLQDVQADLLRLFNAETILIGHSLDSDFKALKLVHRRVIDTTVVFPHKLGPPIKRALRNLMSEYLQKIIQEDAEGHDSKEDAVSCIQLMTWKINEDLKLTKNSAQFKPTPAAGSSTPPSIPPESKATLVRSPVKPAPPTTLSQYKYTNTSTSSSSGSKSSPGLDTNQLNAAKRLAAQQALSRQLKK